MRVPTYLHTADSFVRTSPRRALALLGVLGVIALGISYSKGNNGGEELLTIEPKDFRQEVSVSGAVVAADDVDLAFPESGRVDYLAVKVGDKVARGQVLANLSLGTLRADLALKQAEARNTEVNLERVRDEQNTLVESAYRKLLSSGLVAVPSSASVTATPPTITGRYTGTEGTYKIILSPDEQLSLGGLELRTFELEKTGPTDVLDSEPTPMGTKGLHISFEDDFNAYEDTIWYVTIPNTSSSVYQANYNAYQEAVRARDRAIADAEAALRRQEVTTIAEAEVAKIQAQIADRTLVAPFAGTVTDVDAKMGSVIGANSSAVSLISEASLEIESFVPEINIPLVAVGDVARVTLDAYGEDVPFEARVAFIDPAETVRDGVSTYRIILELVSDSRIRSGMTANVTITTEQKSAVLSVPRGVVQDREGKKIVRVKEGGEVSEREVTLGSVSSTGEVEILSGLSAGDQVILTDE